MRLPSWLARTRERQRDDQGDTLIEILVTILIIGITMTGVIGALTLIITTGETHRRLSDVELVSRTYGEKLVDTAMHAPSTTLSSAAAVGDSTVSVNVSASVTFPSAFTAAIDGEVVYIKSVSADKKTWTLKTGTSLAEAHPSGSNAQQYYFYDASGTGACPTAAFFQSLSTYVPAGSTKIATPSVTTIEYFARDNAGTTGTAMSATTCAGYWKDNAPQSNDSTPIALKPAICSGFAAPEHLTECDIGLIRLTIAAASTDTGSTSASATTSVLIRRDNA